MADYRRYDVEMELFKAYEYFENIDEYLDKIDEFYFNEFHKKINDFKDLKEAVNCIEAFQSKFKLDLEQILIIKILEDRMYIDRKIGLHEIVSKLDWLLPQKFLIDIKKLQGVKIEVCERNESPFSNGLHWQIIDVEPLIKQKLEENSISKNENLGESKLSNKIDWRGNQRLIPYLFRLLNKASYIDEKDIFKLTSETFTSKGKPINREHLASNYSQGDYDGKKTNELPKDAQKIKLIIEKLKEIDGIIESMT